MNAGERHSSMATSYFSSSCYIYKISEYKHRAENTSEYQMRLQIWNVIQNIARDNGYIRHLIIFG